eukprot:CAMPEP_0178998862 /NCGR_PEP_ID=MMETSP0795-20121207/9737_1 /TAXON_ID=88552 /ORGANISM="Amoebophrya sp., Strain Ameob2" /LENGTH=280 /DNA_ID=CAMNT_0020691565 /DNA_START=167 /DNA_END=1009 /DNA_ORIENTATION=-
MKKSERRRQRARTPVVALFLASRLLSTERVAVTHALRLQLQDAERGTDSRRVDPRYLPFLERTKEYLADAREANAAAKHYADLTAKAKADVVGKTNAAAAKEVERLHVKEWAAATKKVQEMLDNPGAANAAAAAAKASAPFGAAANDYHTSMLGYDTAAQDYAVRVQEDVTIAHQLQSYANQETLEGFSPAIASQYHQQAVNLMQQATSYEKLAKSYNLMALKLQAVIPQITAEGNQAAARAAFDVDPGNSLPVEEVYAWTVEPPYLDADGNPVLPPDTK